MSLCWGLLALQECLVNQASLFQLILNAGKALGHKLGLFHVQLFAQKSKGIPQECWGALGLCGTPKPRVLPTLSLREMVIWEARPRNQISLGFFHFSPTI